MCKVIALNPGMVSLPGILQVAGFEVSQNTKSVSSRAEEAVTKGRGQGQEEEQMLPRGPPWVSCLFQLTSLFVPFLLGPGGGQQLNVSFGPLQRPG